MIIYSYKGHRGHDHMIVGFTTTYAISAYHHWCSEFESRSGRGVQQYEIKFVSDLQQVGSFLRVLQVPPSINLIDKIQLKYCWKWRKAPSDKQTSNVNKMFKLKYLLQHYVMCIQKLQLHGRFLHTKHIHSWQTLPEIKRMTQNATQATDTVK